MFRAVSGSMNMENSLVCEGTHAGGWTLPCQGRGSFCCGWAMFLFLVQWAEGALGSGSGGELLFYGRAWGALAQQETAATACLWQEWSQGKLWAGISPQLVGIHQFPFSDNSICNGHFGIIPAAALGTSQRLGVWMRQGHTFVVIWNWDLYRCDFLLFQESLGYLLGLLLNSLFFKFRSLLNYSK